MLKYLIASCCAIACSVTTANAENTRLIGDEIVTFLTQQQPAAPSSLAPSKIEGATVHLIDEVAQSLFTSDSDRLFAAVSAAKQHNYDNNPEWLKTVDFTQGIADIITNSPTQDHTKNLIEYLDTFDPEGDWFLQSVSTSLASFFYVSSNQVLVATERADEAIKVVPSQLSAKVTTARIFASDSAIAIHALQGNPELMLNAARLQATARAEIGETVNRYELMTNFVFALNRARQYESAAQVAELLINEPMPEDNIVGLSEAYMASTFNELNNYAKAETLALAALQGSDHPVVDRRGSLELLVALSGLGKKAAAEQLMVSRGWKYSRDALLATVDNQSILHAEVLLAMHRDEQAYALALMKRRTDLLINQVQSMNSTDISAMLSNLENTRERQVEREGALQREAEMRAIQLEQKTKLNRLLWVLIGGLTIAFNFLLAFLRYREKLNVKVQGLQEDALSAEKMKTEFLGVINHEIRTPLNGIIGISDAMIHHASNPIMREQAETVQESGQLLFDLLDSLITMSTIEGNRLSLDKEEDSLAKTILRETAEWDKAAAKKGLTFTHFIGPELTDAVIADHKRIRQSLRYLLSNAIRFTQAGRVHLHATATPDTDGHLGVTIIVADTGQGISDDVQSRLFKPFLQADATMTRKYGGAGLSLAIARKLARMMGGDLVVKSREGRGTEFTFTARLPLAHTAAEPINADVKPATMAPIPALDAVDEPEAIIDLMLGEQLLSARPDDAGKPQKTRYKAAG
ncbi:MAG: sensor histidine kinase [Litorimonas sp.]